MTLDDLDRRLLNRIQAGFPLAERPYRALAEMLETTEAVVLERLRRLHEHGIIREISPVFDVARVGGVSTLCGAHVAPERLVAVAAFLDAFPEVTHCYEREHRMNLWFTLVGRTPERLDAILEQVRARAGVEHLVSLPSERTFKIRVRFDAEQAHDS